MHFIFCVLICLSSAFFLANTRSETGSGFEGFDEFQPLQPLGQIETEKNNVLSPPKVTEKSESNEAKNYLLKPARSDDDDDDDDNDISGPEVARKKSPPGPGCVTTRKDYKYHFWGLSEFVYGQRALVGDKCDFDMYEKIVRPILKLSIQRDPQWLRRHDDYRLMMKKNLSLRALTCHSSHLMQCSSTPDANGSNHVCECLKELPVYDMTFDEEMNMCTAAGAGHRCFSPFGFECPTGTLCMQANQHMLENGECICVNEKDIPNLQSSDKESCTGCAQDAIEGHVYPYP